MGPGYAAWPAGGAVSTAAAAGSGTEPAGVRQGGRGGRGAEKTPRGRGGKSEKRLEILLGLLSVFIFLRRWERSGCGMMGLLGWISLAGGRRSVCVYIFILFYFILPPAGVLF